MSKFKLLWENNPDTPINASSLSATARSSSELGGIIYKDISQLLPNGLYGDDLLKIRANSQAALRSHTTEALLFNTPGSFVSHDSRFGTTVQDNAVIVKDIDNYYVYAGQGTTNLLSNSGFESGLGPASGWTTTLTDQTQPPGYIDPVWGSEYRAVVQLVDGGYESQKCVRMFNGSFGRTEISRSVNLTNKPVVSFSFYYKSLNGLKFYITSGGLYWKNGDWNQSTSAFYDLPSTGGLWKRIEVKNIITQRIQATASNVGIFVYSDETGGENFIDSFQLEEHTYSSPYTNSIRSDSLLRYPGNIINPERGYIDMLIMPKDIRSFTIFSAATFLPENTVELNYLENVDQFQFKVYDTVTQTYITVNTAARLADRVDTWMRIICGWDRDIGLKIITTSSPYIVSNLTTFTPYTVDYNTTLDIASARGMNIGNILFDVFKINNQLKDDVDIIKDYESLSVLTDFDEHRVFSSGEDSIILNESLLDTGTVFSPNTSYFIWIVDELNGSDAKIVVSKSSSSPVGLKTKFSALLGGFKTDALLKPTTSSVWDIMSREHPRLHAERFTVHGVDSDSYAFDIRSTPYAEVNDIRSTIPINISNNLYGRHSADIYNSQVQYFEVNNTGWVGIDNIKIDGNIISTRNYADNAGTKNNDLEITVSTINNTPKVWVHAHEVVIESGDRDIKLDKVRINDNVIYTKELTDLYIDVTTTDNPTNKNDIYIKAQDININPNNNLNFNVNADFVINGNRDFLATLARNFTVATTLGIITLDEIKINQKDIYNDAGDVHIFSTLNNVDVDSGLSGFISLDDLRVKNYTIYRPSGNINIETPNDIVIGQPGSGTNPYTSNVIIRSDNFTVESQSINFTNVDASDFIKFDSIKIRQSEFYTDSSIPISVNSSGSLTLHSAANVYLNTSNNIELQDTGGSFYSKVASTFTKDLTVKNIIFSDVEASDSAKIFTEFSGATTKLRIQVADDTVDKIILEHRANGQTQGNSMVSIGMDDVVIAKDLVVNGNFTVQGDTVTLNTSTLSVEDNIITLNKNVVGSPSLNAGIEIVRGSLGKAQIVWGEADDLWKLDLGDGILRNLIFNGYDERFDQNVNIVTTLPAGFKVENDFAVGGVELLSPDLVGGMVIGEAVMNVGVHMNQTAGYIKDKTNGVIVIPGSVGAWMSFDTRSSKKKISWMWEEANSSSEVEIASIGSNGQLTTKNIHLTGVGSVSTLNSEVDLALTATDDVTISAGAGASLELAKNNIATLTAATFNTGANTKITGNLNVKNIIFNDVNSTDTASIYTNVDSGVTSLHLNIADDVTDSIILSHNYNKIMEVLSTGVNVTGTFKTTYSIESGGYVWGQISVQAGYSIISEGHIEAATYINAGGDGDFGGDLTAANITTGDINLTGDDTRSNAGTINFRANPGSGIGDSAYIKYYAPEATGEKTRLEFKVSNDADDMFYFAGSDTKFEKPIKIGSSGSIYDGVDSPNGTLRLNYDGYFYATRVYNAVYNDLAEYFLSNDKPEAGKVYVISDNGKLSLSTKRASSTVVGICSDSAAFVMKQEYEALGGVAIALSGSAKVWVGEIIRPGDELVSDKNGFASKASFIDKIFNRGAIIGKAMEASRDSLDKRILVLVGK